MPTPDAELAPRGSEKSKPPHSLNVTVRTLAGHTHHFDVHAGDRVAELTKQAVDYFVKHHHLDPGDYGLALPRLGGDAELNPTDQLLEIGVTATDTLVLVNRAPQVDG